MNINLKTIIQVGIKILLSIGFSLLGNDTWFVHLILFIGCYTFLGWVVMSYFDDYGWVDGIVIGFLLCIVVAALINFLPLFIVNKVVDSQVIRNVILIAYMLFLCVVTIHRDIKLIKNGRDV